MQNIAKRNHELAYDVGFAFISFFVMKKSTTTFFLENIFFCFFQNTEIFDVHNYVSRKSLTTLGMPARPPTPPASPQRPRAPSPKCHGAASDQGGHPDRAGCEK